MDDRTGSPIEILLVEDNPGDVRLTLEALQQGRVTNRVSVAADGEQALAALRSEKAHPDLILLDLNLPKKSGVEVLAELKSDAALRRIPIVVLTSSKADADIARTYDLHANCFVTKPVQLDDFLSVVGSIEHFWLSIVKLPGRTNE